MLSGLNLSRKIAYGYLANVVLIAIVAGFAAVVFRSFAGVFWEYPGTSRETITISELSSSIDATRNAAMTEAIEQSVENIRKRVELASDLFADDPEFLEEIQNLASEIDDYGTSFKETTTLQNRRNHLGARIAADGRGARGRLTGTSNDPHAAVPAGQAQRHLLR